MPNNKNMTGDLGESIANVFLSRRTEQGHLFRTAMIGGKWPTIDIYAEIISDDDTLKFCFFQIKATDLGYTVREHKLRIQVEKEALNRLASFNAPTYLIGINHNEDEPFLSRAYIATIRGNYENPLPSLPTTFELNRESLIVLKDEIIQFWNNMNAMENKVNYQTNFTI